MLTQPAQRPSLPLLQMLHVPPSDSRYHPRDRVAQQQSLRADDAVACIAGFYAQASEQRAAAQALQTLDGVQPENLVLLHPRDAAALRFGRKARRWAHSRVQAPQARVWHGWGALIGALLPGIAAAAWFVPDFGTVSEWQWVLLAPSLALGALIGFGLAKLFQPALRPTRFDRSVQSQLADGCYAVVVHGVPKDNRGDVVALVRGSSQRWCAVATG